VAALLGRAVRFAMSAAVALTLAPGATAAAHPLDPALLELRELGGGAVAVRWKEPPGPAAARPRPALPPECRPEGEPTARRLAGDGGVESTWTMRCPGGLAGARVGVDGLELGGGRALLRVALAGGAVVQRVLSPASPALLVPAQPSGPALVRDYLLLGAEHIAAGADHLLFVLGLFLLVGAARPLALAISGFTLGHSLTLTLAVLGWAPLPAGLVEVGIALSVFALALELTRASDTPSWMRRFPLAMACAFGLLHGLGFAGALRQVGLPAGDVPLALFAFNLGIELGQLAFVALLLAAAALLERLPLALPVSLRQAPVYAMGALAVFWSLERALAWLRLR